MENEYELVSKGVEEVHPTLESMENLQSTLSSDERGILNKIQALSDECADKKIPCFLTAKFDSQEDPSAAWFFGENPPEAHRNFIHHFAPMMLHLSSKLTMTKVTAVNPETGDLVYEVSPDQNSEYQSEQES